MTREELLRTLQEQLTFIGEPLRDGFGQEQLDEMLGSSLFIPKPKFRVGDVVKDIYGNEAKWTIEGRYYSPDKMKWYYTDYGDMISYSESELELVEAAK